MRLVTLKNAKGSSRYAMFVAWAVVLVHGIARSALPSPVEVGSSPSAVTTVPQPVSSPIETGESSDESWSLPPVRLGGNISYTLIRSSSDAEDSTNSTLNGTLNASTRTYIWRPWFATLNADLGFTKLTANSDANGSASSTSSVAVTGNGRLSVLQQSRFPFEAYFERADNRVSNDLTVANGYASQRFGFTQRHGRTDGSEMFGWNRSRQSSNENGENLQDSLVLQISHSLGSHGFQLNGDRSISLHELTGENAVQEALTLQHNFSTSSEITMVNMANVNRSELNLVQGETKNRLLQLSSNVFWRPEEQPMTVSGGARFYSVRGDSDISGLGDPLGMQNSSANIYAGVNYEYSRFTRANANFSASTIEFNGTNVSQTSQTAGIGYQPDDIDFGFAKYNWGTSVSANVQRGGDQSERGLTLQISHRLSQSYKLEGGSTITVDGSQGLSASSINRTSDSTVVTDLLPLTPTRQLTHGASISWNQYDQSGSEQVRLSISDSRALDGPQDYFQLLNFQASNSRSISGYSYWTGNLTIQMMRQGNNGLYYNAGSSSEGVTTSGSGSISYQNQRLLGMRNLRFGSDLRLNIQSLETQQFQQTQFLPQSPFSILESRTRQEVAAWSNRVDYSIGRTRVRLSATISQSAAAQNISLPSTVAATQDPGKRTNRSINLTISRSFGSN